MGASTSGNDPFFRLYARYVGEPTSKTAAYGYWLFIGGILLGVIGVVALLVEFSGGPPPNYPLREGAFVLAALSLPFALLGIVLMLPVRRRGVQMAILGLAVAAAGIVWFSLVYPDGWSPNQTAALVISVYGIGVILVAGSAALIPVVTGERSAFYETETELEPTADQSPLLLGDAFRGALFAVFDTGNDWTWRLVEEEAIADTAEEYLTRLETEEEVDTVKQQIAAAGILEIKGAAFRLYETAAETWRWMLVREDGDVVADGGEDFDTRTTAEESVNLFKEYAPEAEPLAVDGPAFDYVREENRWRWVLLDEARNQLASSPDAYRQHEEAVTTVQTVKDAVPEAGVLSIDAYGIELFQRNGEDAPASEAEAEAGEETAGATAADPEWGWRLLTAEDAEIAHGTAAFESRNAVESAVHEMLEDLDDAVVVEAGDPIYEIVPSGKAWRWRLVGAGADVVARGHGDATDRAGAERDAETMRSTVTGATVFEIEGTSFETYPDGEEWRWRLVDEDRTVIAVGDTTYPDEARAEEAVERVKQQAPEAELIEFEKAAFQIYEVTGQPLEADGGPRAEWRWRLIDEGGDVLADSGDDFGTRGQALSAMTNLKTYAPDAELLEIDTAAFELNENEAGEWHWRLIDPTGTLIARSGRGHPSRQAARQAMNRLVEAVPETSVRTMEAAGFQVYHDDDEGWRWRYLLPGGRTLADATTEYVTRDQATAAIADLREDAATAVLRTIERLAITISESDGTWRWEVVDIDHEPLAKSARTYADRDALDAEVTAIRRAAPDIIVFDIEDFVFRIDRHDGGWSWRLLDEDMTAIANSTRSFDSEQAVREAIDRFRRVVPEAGAIDYDIAAFEVTEGADGWRWRLIDEDEQVIAAGTEPRESSEVILDEIEELTAVVPDASILEIETAAFELYEGEDGWRWRLMDDRGDVVGRSIEAYPDRRAAREVMRSVKEFGPEARTVVAEYA